MSRSSPAHADHGGSTADCRRSTNRVSYRRALRAPALIGCKPGIKEFEQATAGSRSTVRRNINPTLAYPPIYGILIDHRLDETGQHTVHQRRKPGTGRHTRLRAGSHDSRGLIAGRSSGPPGALLARDSDPNLSRPNLHKTVGTFHRRICLLSRLQERIRLPPTSVAGSKHHPSGASFRRQVHREARNSVQNTNLLLEAGAQPEILQESRPRHTDRTAIVQYQQLVPAKREPQGRSGARQPVRRNRRAGSPGTLPGAGRGGGFRPGSAPGKRSQGL